MPQNYQYSLYTTFGVISSCTILLFVSFVPIVSDRLSSRSQKPPHFKREQWPVASQERTKRQSGTKPKREVREWERGGVDVGGGDYGVRVHDRSCDSCV